MYKTLPGFAIYRMFFLQSSVQIVLPPVKTSRPSAETVNEIPVYMKCIEQFITGQPF